MSVKKKSHKGEKLIKAVPGINKFCPQSDNLL
jgi:hypothetical protein